MISVTRSKSCLAPAGRGLPCAELAGAAASEVRLPRPARSRGWLEAALLECASCHQVAERRSPAQRHCPERRSSLREARSRAAVARARGAGRPALPTTQPAAGAAGAQPARGGSRQPDRPQALGSRLEVVRRRIHAERPIALETWVYRLVRERTSSGDHQRRDVAWSAGRLATMRTSAISYLAGPRLTSRGRSAARKVRGDARRMTPRGGATRSV